MILNFLAISIISVVVFALGFVCGGLFFKSLFKQTISEQLKIIQDVYSDVQEDFSTHAQLNLEQFKRSILHEFLLAQQTHQERHSSGYYHGEEGDEEEEQEFFDDADNEDDDNNNNNSGGSHLN